MRILGDRVDLDGLIADAEEEGRTVEVIPAGATKEESLAAFSEVLNFPEWFGMNLDALADCLDTFARETTNEWELVWDGVARLRESDPKAAAGIESVLADVGADHPKVHMTIINR
ncbi:barstar (barnase inhibitor) [Knoellia remsis]|uniref:Barstar (Barnase inhibitor) n=1 Tax=Knoellia remsis TaxID=407159 RepID=A0A2T0UZJ0_9MICO|nr:barstar family protein [Knoellia remsis]PRY63350.1 barstar (barnase inhibitor) [Knoellia remsis]